MAHFHILITPLFALLLLILTHGSSARPTLNPGPKSPLPPPPPQPAGPAQEFLDAHNRARAAVMVPPLKWNTAIAAEAASMVAQQRARNNCQFADLSSDKIKYGANQLWARGTVVSPRMVVEAWVGEKKFYNYSGDSCVANHQCGVYKQVVWRNSAELGCAQASCAKDASTLTVCFYNPPGNVDGEKPY